MQLEEQEQHKPDVQQKHMSEQQQRKMQKKNKKILQQQQQLQRQLQQQQEFQLQQEKQQLLEQYLLQQQDKVKEQLQKEQESQKNLLKQLHQQQLQIKNQSHKQYDPDSGSNPLEPAKHNVPPEVLIHEVRASKESRISDRIKKPENKVMLDEVMHQTTNKFVNEDGPKFVLSNREPIMRGSRNMIGPKGMFIEETAKKKVSFLLYTDIPQKVTSADNESKENYPYQIQSVTITDEPLLLSAVISTSGTSSLFSQQSNQLMFAKTSSNSPSSTSNMVVFRRRKNKRHAPLPPPANFSASSSALARSFAPSSPSLEPSASAEISVIAHELIKNEEIGPKSSKLHNSQYPQKPDVILHKSNSIKSAIEEDGFNEYETLDTVVAAVRKMVDISVQTEPLSNDELTDASELMTSEIMTSELLTSGRNSPSLKELVSIEPQRPISQSFNENIEPIYSTVRHRRQNNSVHNVQLIASGPLVSITEGEIQQREAEKTEFKNNDDLKNNREIPPPVPPIDKLLKNDEGNKSENVDDLSQSPSALLDDTLHSLPLLAPVLLPASPPPPPPLPPIPSSAINANAEKTVFSSHNPLLLDWQSELVQKAANFAAAKKAAKAVDEEFIDDQSTPPLKRRQFARDLQNAFSRRQQRRENNTMRLRHFKNSKRHSAPNKQQITHTLLLRQAREKLSARQVTETMAVNDSQWDSLKQQSKSNKNADENKLEKVPKSSKKQPKEQKFKVKSSIGKAKKQLAKQAIENLERSTQRQREIRQQYAVDKGWEIFRTEKFDDPPANGGSIEILSFESTSVYAYHAENEQLVLLPDYDVVIVTTNGKRILQETLIQAKKTCAIGSGFQGLVREPNGKSISQTDVERTELDRVEKSFESIRQLNKHQAMKMAEADNHNDNNNNDAVLSNNVVLQEMSTVDLDNKLLPIRNPQTNLHSEEILNLKRKLLFKSTKIQQNEARGNPLYCSDDEEDKQNEMTSNEVGSTSHDEFLKAEAQSHNVHPTEIEDTSSTHSVGLVEVPKAITVEDSGYVSDISSLSIGASAFPSKLIGNSDGPQNKTLPQTPNVDSVKSKSRDTFLTDKIPTSEPFTFASSDKDNEVISIKF